MNIFVTVGTQLPFDRMVRTVDDWVGTTPGVTAFAQIGPARYRPRHMDFDAFIDAAECRRKVSEADAVIAHAGMGSIITALEFGKPLIVMPRRAALGEHRNDHQLATAHRLSTHARITMAFEEQSLRESLAALHLVGNAPFPIERMASEKLIHRLQVFLDSPSIPTMAGPSKRLGLKVATDANVGGIRQLEPA